MPENVNFNLLIVCSMSCNITVSVSDDFAKEAKHLSKKYPSFKQDYKDFLDSIKENPLQGDEITKNIRKIRMVFGRCTGIIFVDSTMIPVCHNLRRYANKVFKGIATDGKRTMGWCHGFKLHLACNDRGEIIAFVLTGANVSDKNPEVFKVLAKRLYGKLFADKGYISQKLFDFLFEDGIQLVTGLRVNMKNKLMPFYDRMMLRKRYIIETINDMLKNKAQIVHSCHRSVSNFIMNLISALRAYYFFDNKPSALSGYTIEDTKQLNLF